jgi:hypothetical protein
MRLDGFGSERAAESRDRRVKRTRPAPPKERLDELVDSNHLPRTERKHAEEEALAFAPDRDAAPASYDVKWSENTDEWGPVLLHTAIIAHLLTADAPSDTGCRATIARTSASE